MERCIDIIFSFIALLLLLPLVLPIMLILRFSGEGEVFFLQERIGRDGNKFKLFKFATMLKDSPNIGTGTVTLNQDPRILPFGHFLRKSKINELPQLLNILLGNMSFVGPRPLTKQNFDFYPRQVQEVILKVRPGLSGIGSIIFRGEEDLMVGRNANTEFYRDVISPYKGLLEVWFVNNKNTYLYFVIIFLTIMVVMFPKNNIIWRSISNLPTPPTNLQHALSFQARR